MTNLLVFKLTMSVLPAGLMCISAVSAIYLGQRAKKGIEDIYMGSLQEAEGNIHLCGATFISGLHLLTACQCVIQGGGDSSFPETIVGSYQVVAYGLSNAVTDRARQSRTVMRFGFHRNCEFDKVMSIWKYDLGFIKLVKRFDVLEGTFVPLRVAINQHDYETEWNNVKRNKGVWVNQSTSWLVTLGWGAEDIDCNQIEMPAMPEMLKRRLVNLIPDSECKTELCARKKEYCHLDLGMNVICVKPSFDTRGTLCLGDAGAPLISNNSILAIGSWAELCGKWFTVNIYYRLDITEINKFVAHADRLTMSNLCVIFLWFAVLKLIKQY